MMNADGPQSDDLKSLREQLALHEQRIAALEQRKDSGTSNTHAQDLSVDSRFWALERLQSESPNSVLFTGSVDLESGEHYAWQQQNEPMHLLQRDSQRLASAMAALGSQPRLDLLKAIYAGQGEITALQNVPGMGTKGQIYHHLRQLESAGWVESGGRGRYRIPAARVVPLLVMLAAALPLD